MTSPVRARGCSPSCLTPPGTATGKPRSVPCKDSAPPGNLSAITGPPAIALAQMAQEPPTWSPCICPAPFICCSLSGQAVFQKTSRLLSLLGSKSRKLLLAQSQSLVYILALSLSDLLF